MHFIIQKVKLLSPFILILFSFAYTQNNIELKPKKEVVAEKKVEPAKALSKKIMARPDSVSQKIINVIKKRYNLERIQ